MTPIDKPNELPGTLFPDKLAPNMSQHPTAAGALPRVPSWKTRLRVDGRALLQGLAAVHLGPAMDDAPVFSSDSNGYVMDNDYNDTLQLVLNYLPEKSERRFRVSTSDVVNSSRVAFSCPTVWWQDDMFLEFDLEAASNFLSLDGICMLGGVSQL